MKMNKNFELDDEMLMTITGGEEVDGFHVYKPSCPPSDVPPIEIQQLPDWVNKG